MMLPLAMHLPEGLLPARQAVAWFLFALPWIAWGIWRVKRHAQNDPLYKPLVALVGAGVFVLSCMPIPLPGIGSCSHPCGTGLAAILIGPGATIVISSIALLLQALFLSHGGLSTLGVNVAAMGIVGGMSGWLIFIALRKLRCPQLAAVFTAAMISDWATYGTTSLALALLADGSHFVGAFLTTLLAFVPSQLPLGIAEGIVSMEAVRFIRSRRPELLTLKGARREVRHGFPVISPGPGGRHAGRPQDGAAVLCGSGRVGGAEAGGRAGAPGVSSID